MHSMVLVMIVEMQDKKVQEDNSPETPIEVKVYAQVNLANCPRQLLNKADLRSVEGIIFRYDHLRKNVKHVDFGEYRTYRSNLAEHYDHSIWVNLMVSTAFLWKNARSCIAYRAA